MSIPLPSLDDRRYDDLLEEARALIPSLAPQWTNHNPSDPGITLIELFAWLTEMLIYGINRLPEENTRAFLQLVNGPQWAPGADLDEDIRTTVLGLRRRYRAVTAKDHEVLAREASPGVARACCIPRRKLDGTAEADWRIPQEGYLSLIVVPDPEQTGALDSESLTGAPSPSRNLLSKVDAYLQPRRMLTVRQVVVPPVYVPIQAEVVVAVRPDVPVTGFNEGVADALTGFLDPLTGGPDGKGWPFGRDVYISELYRLLEKISGVDYVPDITLSSTCQNSSPRCVAGVELWHKEGDQIGIELSAHHLPWAQFKLERIVVGSAFQAVHIEIQATAKKGFEATARRAAKTAIKRLFHPLHGGPGRANPWEVTKDEITRQVANLPGIERIASVILGDKTRTKVHFKAGELADVAVTIKV